MEAFPEFPVASPAPDLPACLTVSAEVTRVLMETHISDLSGGVKRAEYLSSLSLF